MEKRRRGASNEYPQHVFFFVEKYEREALLMNTFSICFNGEIRKRCTSNEYNKHMFLWRNKKARHF